MTFPVLVTKHEDKFAASLIGAPDVRSEKPTRSMAVAALEAEIHKRIETGELLSLEIDAAFVSGMAGKYRNDSTLKEIYQKAYEKRDSEINERGE